MKDGGYPTLYQINTRVHLTDLSTSLGRPATLDDIPDAELDRVADIGLRWVWLLSVWQTGSAGQRSITISNPEWRREFQETLPDLREDDIAGSGFAITGYTVHRDLGGDAALARLRERLRQRGLRLMLDFVPNHTGLDHPWADDHPEYYVHGTEQDLARAPRNYVWVKRNRRRSDSGARARSVLPWLAGYAAAQLRQLRHAGCDDRRAVKNRRAMRRRTLRHGDAAAARRLRANLGSSGATHSGPRQSRACGSGLRTSASWPRSTGTANGHCSSKGSTTPTTSGSTTACAWAGAAGARAPAGRARLPEQARAFPGEPRRASGGRDILARYPRGRRCDHLPVTRPPVLSRGSVRGAAKTRLAALGSCSA